MRYAVTEELPENQLKIIAVDPGDRRNYMPSTTAVPPSSRIAVAQIGAPFKPSQAVAVQLARRAPPCTVLTNNR